MMKRLQSSLKLTLPPHESPGWESKEKCSPLSLKSSNQQLPHKHEPFCCCWDMLAGAIHVQWAGRRLQSFLAAGVQQSPGPQYLSCSSGHTSPPLQMLFLDPPWHPVFWCPLPCKNRIQDASRLCNAGRSYFKALLFCTRTALGPLKCPYLPCFSWLILVAYSPFSEQQKNFKSHFTGTSCTPVDGHSMEHLCGTPADHRFKWSPWRSLWAFPVQGERWPDSPGRREAKGI